MAENGADRSFVVAVRVRPPHEQERMHGKNVCYGGKSSLGGASTLGNVQSGLGVRLSVLRD